MPEYEIKVAVHRQANRVWETTVTLEADSPEAAEAAAEMLAERKAADIDFNQFSEEDVTYEVAILEVIPIIAPGQKSETPAVHPTAKLYQIWGPDGIPIAPRLYVTADIAMRAAAIFVARYQQQGYYRDSSGRELSLDTLAWSLRLEEHPALMTSEEAYDKYLERFSALDDYMTLNEFLVSDECIELMDPDYQDDED